MTGSPSPGGDGPLLEVLARAQVLGFLGPGPVADHVRHAERFVSAMEAVGAGPPTSALDLGSGGGVPGLVLACWWPASRWVLLDSMVRRTDPLAQAVDDLGLTGRVEVVCARAEAAGRDPERRAGFDLVTARSFGTPAATVECGAAFLRPGGRLVVSDPPDGPGDRWPTVPLAELGILVEHQGQGCTVLRQTEPYPSELPRRIGVPSKRPLF